MPMIHLHIWRPPSDPDNSDSEPLAEVDFEEFDRQPNMSTPPEDDGYIQFGATDPLTGRHLELRISNELIKKLAKEIP